RPPRTVPPSFPTRRSSDLRHLYPVRAHHNGAPGTFEQGVVRKRNAIFSDKKAVSSIQYLIVLVVGHHRKNGTFGFVYPLWGLCQDRKSTRLNSSHVSISYA